MADHTPVAVSTKGCPSQRCEPSLIIDESILSASPQGNNRIEPNECSQNRHKCKENGALYSDDLDASKSENLDLELDPDLPTKSVVEHSSKSKTQSVCVDSSIIGTVEDMKLGKKINGLTHPEHIAGNGELLNLLNTCCQEEVSGSHCCDDSGRGSGSVCHCTETDCDDVSCEEIGIVDKRPPEVLCESEHNEVDVLLTNLEKVSISQLCNSNDISNNVINGITYVVYESEKQMPDIMRLITKDLSEPYSIYTYRYFIHNWPKLCFLAMADEKCVGAIVCKLDLHKKMVRRGYIAMLAVDSEYRRRQIGSTLVTKAIEAMIRDDCDEVVLETEITNQGALHLYENLGFVRDKRLFRYYLNGVDALRLKLWLR